jgi:hypothetical protein
MREMKTWRLREWERREHREVQAMVTTVTTKNPGGASTKTKTLSLGETGRRAGGNGSRGGPQPPNGNDGDPRSRAARDTTPQQYRIGMWLALSAILMMFAALTSAYVFRSTRTQQEWQIFAVPQMLWVSTLLILASSATFEAARRAERSLRRSRSASVFSSRNS